MEAEAALKPHRFHIPGQKLRETHVFPSTFFMQPRVRYEHSVTHDITASQVDVSVKFQALNRPLDEDKLGPVDASDPNVRLYPMNHPVKVYVTTNEGLGFFLDASSHIY